MNETAHTPDASLVDLYLNTYAVAMGYGSSADIPTDQYVALCLASTTLLDSAFKLLGDRTRAAISKATPPEGART